ncbi:hypothetical protein AURDEDRAFT_69819 [Auricularia subglabra TFB-10046 SS5]|nr:hypothetical protein AURDEDRAFT_69819 [Auricularia subglabra TFB-10046 SS5]
MPLDLAEATYLVQPTQPRLSTTDLIVLRARQLQRRENDLEAVRALVLDSRVKNVQDFVRRHGNSVRDWKFDRGALVLVRNMRIEKDLGLKKVEDRYHGPMVVVERRAGGAYTIAELDGSVSILKCASFRVIPYFPRYGQLHDISDILDTAHEQLRLIQLLDDDDAEDGNKVDDADASDGAAEN